MIRKRKKTFVLVVPQFEDIFHSFYAGEIIKGVGLAASRLKVDILIHIVDRGDHRAWLDSTLLDPKYIDGIIFGDIDNDLGVVKVAINRGIPTMVLNNYFEQPFNCVAIDNYKATIEVIKNLIKLGHSRIATIAGDLNTQAGQLRLNGFRDAMKEAGLEIPKGYEQEGVFLRTPAREAAQKLLKLKERPTAIFAASDVMALEVLGVAKDAGIKVPQDLSVIGFDDNPLIWSSSVKLSTVFQPLIEMGRLGAEQLTLISNGKAKLPVKVLLPAKVKMRESTAGIG